MTMNDCLAATGTDAGPVILSIAVFLIAVGIVAAIRGRGKGAMAALLALPLLLGAVVISQTGAVTAYAAVDCPPEDSGVDADAETAEPTPTPTPTPTTEPDPSPEPSPSPDPEPSPDPSPSPDPEPSPSPDPQPDCVEPGDPITVSQSVEGEQVAPTDGGQYLMAFPITAFTPEDWTAAGFSLPITIPGVEVDFSGADGLLYTASLDVTFDEFGDAFIAVDQPELDPVMPDDRLLFVSLVDSVENVEQDGCDLGTVVLSVGAVFQFNSSSL